MLLGVLFRELGARFDDVGNGLRGLSNEKDGLDARSWPNVKDGVADGV
jgi:hypothetical protein